MTAVFSVDPAKIQQAINLSRQHYIPEKSKKGYEHFANVSTSYSRSSINSHGALGNQGANPRCSGSGGSGGGSGGGSSSNSSSSESGNYSGRTLDKKEQQRRLLEHYNKNRASSFQTGREILLSQQKQGIDQQPPLAQPQKTHLNLLTHGSELGEVDEKALMEEYSPSEVNSSDPEPPVALSLTPKRPFSSLAAGAVSDSDDDDIDELLSLKPFQPCS
mmetsp:Transcript_47561/g.107853  ORF Transcript_47561/g.107853 Transcript_47561/m.107853 type:complete len:218 (+) Transcript_47561:78-731(+)